QDGHAVRDRARRAEAAVGGEPVAAAGARRGDRALPGEEAGGSLRHGGGADRGARARAAERAARAALVAPGARTGGGRPPRAGGRGGALAGAASVAPAHRRSAEVRGGRRGAELLARRQAARVHLGPG